MAIMIEREIELSSRKSNATCCELNLMIRLHAYDCAGAYLARAMHEIDKLVVPTNYLTHSVGKSKGRTMVEHATIVYCFLYLFIVQWRAEGLIG